MARSDGPLKRVGTAVALFTSVCLLGSFPPSNASPSAPGVASLRVCGSALCAGNQRFRWAGVTAFGLVDLLADGRDEEARAFVKWASDTGFNVLRVLAMLPNGGWLDLSPDAGREALPRAFALAKEHGMYVQAVALANTDEASGRFRTEAFLREQVREVARLCSAAGNCVLEIANEPYHGSQARLENPALMRRLQREVPAGLPTAWGAADEDFSTAMGGGTYIVVHISRSGDRWERIARMRGLASLSAATGKFVVDNEPVGAAEAPERSRRDSAPEAFFAQGVASRLVEAGSTFHCEDCLRARVPRPVQQQCAAAFIQGRRAVPDEVVMEKTDERTAPATLATRRADRALLSGIDGNRAWVLALGEGTSDAMRWHAGWTPETRVAERPGVVLWSAVRSRREP